MKEKQQFLRSAPFSRDEEKLIEKAKEVLISKRKYGTKGFFWHDAVLAGCRQILADEKKHE